MQMQIEKKKRKKMKTISAKKILIVRMYNQLETIRSSRLFTTHH